MLYSSANTHAFYTRWLKRLPLLWIALVGCSGISAQTYNYTQYSLDQGLAGNIVYDITQDKEGFMWFATETGVSRFDGTTFRNITTSDGLPDNATIHLFADSRNRMWFVPFRNTISYCYKGKVYNQQQDTALRKMRFTNIIHSIIEDKDQNIIIASREELYILTREGKVISLGNRPPGLMNSIDYITSDEQGNIYMMRLNCLYLLSKGRAIPLHQKTTGYIYQVASRNARIYWRSDNEFHISGSKTVLKFPVINNFKLANDSMAYLNTSGGTILFNTASFRTMDHFLPGENVSSCYTDREGNTWFGTLNNGIFRMHSAQFKCIRHTADNKRIMVHALYDNGHELLVGTEDACLKIGFHPDVRISKAVTQTFKRPVSFIAMTDHQLLVTSGDNFYSFSDANHAQQLQVTSSVKKVFLNPDGSILVAASNGLLQFNSLRPRDYVVRYQERTTAVYVSGNTTYLGTFHGLYTIDSNNVLTAMSHLHPYLGNRITAIAMSSDSTLCVATSGGGVFGIRHQRVLWHFDSQNGLSSSDIHCIVPDTGGSVWIGTDKGLDQLKIKDSATKINHYTTADGLASGFINTIVIRKDTVFVGTLDGLTFFDKTRVHSTSICDLKILGISSNGLPVGQEQLSALEYADNHIRFDFTAISFKSEGDISYYYRLLPKDPGWKMIHQNFLEFISLPPGSYQLEMYAVNKFNVKSKTIAIPLKVIPKFWQTGWFLVGISLVIIFITWAIVAYRNKIYNQRQSLSRQMEQRLSELEQKALRAQMNPHFIFNCLHAVQEYILEQDIINANKYLSSFARLIRQTLDNSLQTTIPISDEVSYLKNYLTLEQLRFDNKLQYAFHIDSTLDAYDTKIPSMMLQPYVENAIRHGIGHGWDRAGLVEISFKKSEQHVICEIQDNGIGITAAQALKASKHAAHKSRGMQLVAERIELLSKAMGFPIMIEITDLKNTPGKLSGTRVTIRLPHILTKKTVYD
ncbi:sensor histidine kinase [Chitinophaga vietnamensis]|uniref:sensor histidine kinase n=1 Tax=Chitinophaga vietnamensis TaxID=2593957 RepID=UPI00117824EF|nr:sensor histidine kinase [Chitinophaga vietnamensis]